MLGLLLLVITHPATPDIVFGGKAALVSSTTSCGCQCSSLGFRGSDGSLQGNCLSSDSLAGAWCYVDNACSSCGDLQTSERFPGHSWSYQAKSGRWTVMGLVAWGVGCASDLPGVYVRMSYFKDWIDA